jgi:hypothetical protein
MKNEFPRRNRLDQNTPAEKAIYDAMQEVEKAGADVLLTDAVVLLDKARNLVADYVDAQQKLLNPTGLTKLEQLAFYLPYELVCLVDGKKAILNSVYSDGTCSFASLVESAQGFQSIKPILKPMSDANDLIKSEFDKLYAGKDCDKVIIDLFCTENYGNGIIAKMHVLPEKISFECIRWLLKNHYDIFDMCDRGEAVMFMYES